MPLEEIWIMFSLKQELLLHLLLLEVKPDDAISKNLAKFP
jgi:hypothetical protein